MLKRNCRHWGSIRNWSVQFCRLFTGTIWECQAQRDHSSRYHRQPRKGSGWPAILL